MASWQAIGPLILAPQAASLAGQDMQQQQQQHLQQQKFFDAFQAAVDQHTGVRCPLSSLPHLGRMTQVLWL